MGSHQLKLSDLDKIKKISLKNPIESCGLVCSEGVYELKNTAINPCCFFEVDPQEYFDIFISKKVLFFWHSHVFGSEKPSDCDVAASKEVNLPSLIYSSITNKFCFFNAELIKPVYFCI